MFFKISKKKKNFFFWQKSSLIYGVNINDLKGTFDYSYIQNIPDFTRYVDVYLYDYNLPPSFINIYDSTI